MRNHFIYKRRWLNIHHYRIAVLLPGRHEHCFQCGSRRMVSGITEKCQCKHDDNWQTGQ